MTDALVLPRAKARRRRMPRPPKFTRKQKIELLLEGSLGAFYLYCFLTGSHASLFGVAATVTGMRGTVLLAMNRPLQAILAMKVAIALYATTMLALTIEWAT